MKLFLLVLVALLAAPAAVLAQKDNLKMGEALKANVVKKSEAKDLKAQKAPEPQRARFRPEFQRGLVGGAGTAQEYMNAWYRFVPREHLAERVKHNGGVQ